MICLCLIVLLVLHNSLATSPSGVLTVAALSKFVYHFAFPIYFSILPSFCENTSCVQDCNIVTISKKW